MRIDARACDTVRDFRMIQRVFAEMDIKIISATISEKLWKAYINNFDEKQASTLEKHLAKGGEVLLDGITCFIDYEKDCPTCDGLGKVKKEKHNRFADPEIQSVEKSSRRKNNDRTQNI